MCPIMAIFDKLQYHAKHYNEKNHSIKQPTNQFIYLSVCSTKVHGKNNSRYENTVVLELGTVQGTEQRRRQWTDHTEQSKHTSSTRRDSGAEYKQETHQEIR